MTTSTSSDATSRLLLHRAGAARGRPRGAGDQAAALSSAAGVHRRPWLGRLRRALQEGLFELHFQPIVSLRHGGVSHYEALVRLADEPDGRLVAPGHFLPAAERYGLVRDIDRMVIDRVAALLAARPAREHGGVDALRVAVNVSAVSVSDGSLLGHLGRRLGEHALDPARLMVELTETAAISDMERARSFCAGLRALGCAIALDDFGAGFGSFRYLKHLPFTHLKIDGEFIHGLPGSRTDQLVVKALAGLAQGLGRETIAEFVGDEPTAEMLRSYGVDYAQGFHIGRPRAALP